jgi:hypothetical protein
MKPLLAASMFALIPTVAAASDMHAFDYTGNGNPVALVASTAQPKPAQAAASAASPSPLFLTRQSNFSVFFKPDVPAAVQRQALRILWATHPELAQPDLTASRAVSYPTEPQTTTVAALQQ